MTERLIVKGFAGIENVELDIGKINILIGPQAAGKSVCAKLLYYFKSFLWEMRTAIQNEETIHDLDGRMLEKFKKYFPPISWPTSAFSIRYEIGKNFLQIDRTKTSNGKIKIHYSKYYKDKFQEYLSIFREKVDNWAAGDNEDIILLANLSSFEKILTMFHDEVDSMANYEPLFIPAGRSFFANLQDNIFSLLSNDQTIDPFLIEFGSYYERVKKIPIKLLSRQCNNKNFEKQINRINELILHGKYERQKNKDILIQGDGRKICLENASSGQQEILPLSIMLSFLFYFNLEKSSTTVYIEEPEAHLFPTAQRHIVELIATVFNTKPDKLQFVITTHSPYILTSFNNLMHAGTLAKKLKDKKSNKLNKIVPEQYQLQPEYVKAYAIREGTQQNLISPESELISADIIDEVSNELSVQFGDLLEVEENA